MWPSCIQAGCLPQTSTWKLVLLSKRPLRENHCGFKGGCLVCFSKAAESVCGLAMVETQLWDLRPTARAAMFPMRWTCRVICHYSWLQSLVFCFSGPPEHSVNDPGPFNKLARVRFCYSQLRKSLMGIESALCLVLVHTVNSVSGNSLS